MLNMRGSNIDHFLNLRREILSIAFICLMVFTHSLKAQAPYKPTWESLEQYKIPEWFQDAKFGIYAHWGPVSSAFEGRIRRSIIVDGME
ncbi:alpha-L-fucosidase [Echinicola strongylocentroti]|uniref:alpha-L-fucosidase n=1 Tax=Echinicola strongylocentroti TaxID=1795355 RepID=UPI001B884382|nr:alpha-L-fucosidase [Echinicola strongylocentroti]